jgi:hypothetical protein
VEQQLWIESIIKKELDPNDNPRQHKQQSSYEILKRMVTGTQKLNVTTYVP